MDFLRKICIIGLILALCGPLPAQEKARIYEEEMVMRTYPFSDPDPVANIGRIYPYFKFDGYTNRPKNQTSKFVIRENK
jgi:hypothetical protein